MYAIEAIDLGKMYGKRIILYDFSIKIPTGSIYGLLGPNGAGKSTFIRIIAGLERQDDGLLKILEKPPNRESRKQLGIAPQENSFHNLLTCFENLMYYAELYGVRRKEASERAHELLEMLGLKERKDILGAWLSGGMKRRLNLACALIHKPKIIILDEPTTGLDPISRIKMWDAVKYVQKKENATIILTTHYMEEAEALCDEISFVNKGHVLRTGSPEALKRIIGKEFLRIKSSPGKYDKLIPLIRALEGIKNITISDGELLIEAKNTTTKLTPITRILNENKEEIADLRISPPTLEDVFIKLTGAPLRQEKHEARKHEATG